MSEYTPEKLKEWAENGTVVDSVAKRRIADAWAAEAERRKAAEAEVRRLQEALESILDQFCVREDENPEAFTLLSAQGKAQEEPCPHQSSAFGGSAEQCQKQRRCFDFNDCPAQWRTATSHSRPELGDMEAVEVRGKVGYLDDEGELKDTGLTSTFGPMPVRDVAWDRVVRYRRVYHNGHPAVVNDGCLEKWAEFVTTDYGGDVWQWEVKPKTEALHWEAGGELGCPAPSHYAIPGPWQDSLRSVLPEGE